MVPCEFYELKDKKLRLTRLTVRRTLLKVIKLIKQAKVHAINKLTKIISGYESRKGTESQILSNRNKSQRLKAELFIIKSCSKIEAARYAIELQVTPDCVLNNGNSLNDAKALARLAKFAPIRNIVDKFRSKYPGWTTCTHRFLDKFNYVKYPSSPSMHTTNNLDSQESEITDNLCERCEVEDDTKPIARTSQAAKTKHSPRNRKRPTIKQPDPTTLAVNSESLPHSSILSDVPESGDDCASENDNRNYTRCEFSESSSVGSDESGSYASSEANKIVQVPFESESCDTEPEIQEGQPTNMDQPKSGLFHKDLVNIPRSSSEENKSCKAVRNSAKSSFFVGGHDPEKPTEEKDPDTIHVTTDESSFMAGCLRKPDRQRTNLNRGLMRRSASTNGFGYERRVTQTARHANQVNGKNLSSSNKTAPSGEHFSDNIGPRGLKHDRKQNTGTRGNDELEGLHPSWAAKKSRKSIDLSQKGKKIVF